MVKIILNIGSTSLPPLPEPTSLNPTVLVADPPSPVPEPSTSSFVKLFDVLCPRTTFLSDDVLNNKAFMKCVTESQASLMYFFHLRSLYSSKKTRERQSTLKKSLDRIQANIDTTVLQIEEASKLKINPAVGVDRLAQTCIRKQQVLTSIGQSLLALKAQVSSGDVLNSLRRRVKQQSSKNGDYSIVCSNLPELTWEIAFRTLEDQQNSGLNTFPLQFADLRSVAYHNVYTVCYIAAMMTIRSGNAHE